MPVTENYLEDFRLLYYKKYGKQLDDEILYILIRINELNASINKAHSEDISCLEMKIEELKKEVKQQLSLRTKWDYFMYGLAKSISYAIVAIVLFLVVAFYFYHKNFR